MWTTSGPKDVTLLWSLRYRFRVICLWYSTVVLSTRRFFAWLARARAAHDKLGQLDPYSNTSHRRSALGSAATSHFTPDVSSS
jgi:hypothetical protein